MINSTEGNQMQDVLAEFNQPYPLKSITKENSNLISSDTRRWGEISTDN
jgi:hypothetical protein